MEDKIKLIISQIVIFGITGALIMCSTSSCKKDKGKHNPTALSAPEPPHGYARNEYQQLWKFFMQNSSEPGKNNLAIIKEQDRDFAIDNPTTWNVNPNGRGPYGITFVDSYPSNSNDVKRVDDIAFSHIMFSKLSGTLDLSGCNKVDGIYLNGTHIKQIKVPKESLCGKRFWAYDHLTQEGIDFFKSHGGRVNISHEEAAVRESGRAIAGKLNKINALMRSVTSSTNELLGAENKDIEVILVD